jgi:hypothetical protein
MRSYRVSLDDRMPEFIARVGADEQICSGLPIMGERIEAKIPALSLMERSDKYGAAPASVLDAETI